MQKLFLVLLIVAGTLSACTSTNQAQTQPTIALPDQPVSEQTAESSSVSIVVASGNVVAKTQAHLGFANGGTIVAINVEEGTIVEAGQVLIKLDTDLLSIELALAENDLAEITSPMAIAQAESDLASAKDALADQQDKVDALIYPRASDERIENNQAAIDLAKKEVALASDAYRLVARLEDGNERKATAILNLTNAQMRLDSLIATQNWYVGRPTDLDASITRANYQIAVNTVQEMEWYLAELKGESIPDSATGINLARLRAARLRVESLRLQISKNQIISPFAGTVAKVDAVIGQLAVPGQSIVFLVDTKDLRVETTDLSEKDIRNIFVGQSVIVRVDALGMSVDGVVSLIDPIAQTLGGDVVYNTNIKLINPPADLRAGMSVDVEYLSE